MKYIDMEDVVFTAVRYLVDSLQLHGVHTFTRSDAQAKVPVLKASVNRALQALEQKRTVIRPKQDFFVIVPPEYRGYGGPSPSWYIDQLMHHIGQPYYVGILSAAELHGSAHQRPQVFQVVTDKPQRRIDVPRKGPRKRIIFYQKMSITRTPTVQFKVPTGYFKVSSPEATAYDLINYYKAAGGLNRAAEVLGGLAKRLDVGRLKALLETGCKTAPIQRLGYILDLLGYASLTEQLHYKLIPLEPVPVPLAPYRSRRGSPRNEKWNVYVNARIEV